MSESTEFRTGPKGTQPSPQSTDKFDRLKDLLRAMFQLDRGDLDFGLYRIMNLKAAEIDAFLENDLLPQVKTVLAELVDDERAALYGALTEAREAAWKLRIDPDEQETVVELKRKLAEARADAAAEAEVYNHLANFFARYYAEGDFISQRRYSGGGRSAYLIPYDGEEVKLHWANQDQYYVKTTENYSSYAFTVGPGAQQRRVRFEIAAADGEKDNIKETSGKQRRFVLTGGKSAITIEGRDLVVRFEHRPLAEREKKTWPGSGSRQQDRINESARQRIFRALAPDWLALLAAPAPTESHPDRSVLDKHLAVYTARNSFDYFIHKDLGGFLRRELDFYLKNEVLNLDDLTVGEAARLSRALARTRAVRQVADKITTFLAQIEDFQKHLWLKKKFVLETQWCVTLDRVPEALYPEIVANDAQRQEWVNLFAINRIEGNLANDNAGYTQPLTQQFLKTNPYLVLDTRHFDRAFRDRLLAALSDTGPLEDQLDGLLVHGENFQALNLLQARYRGQIKTIAIDPPYNRLGDSFLYKDSYRHSSWLTMMRDRLDLARVLLQRDGALFSNIDENERDSLQAVLDGTFDRSNRIEELIWGQNTTHSQSPLYSTNHEYIEVYVRNRVAAERATAMFREAKPGFLELMELVNELNPRYPTIAKVEEAIKDLFSRHVEQYKVELQQRNQEYDREARRQDPWRGIYNYCHGEYRNGNGRVVCDQEARAKGARLVIWRESDSSAPAQKQSDTTQDPTHANYRFYRPLHPVTKKPCRVPKRGWAWPQIWPDDTRDSFVALDRAGRIVWGEDETKVPQYKRFVHDVETNVAKSLFHDYTDGEKQIAALFGVTGLFPTPKPTTLPRRFISQTSTQTSLILDHFAGSGTTGHAVVNLNRKDGGSRKYILVEVGHHFDTVLLPRMKKVVYSPDWKDGQPISRNGSTQCFKYIRLESYEDTLDGLELTPRADEQGALLAGNPALGEDYRLRYALGQETSESACLLGKHFTDPFAYTLSVVRGGIRQETPVDLPETFNFLIGLRLEFRRRIDGVLAETGADVQGRKCLILWRNLIETDNTALEAWFVRNRAQFADSLDIVYVNGDHTLNAVRQPDECWNAKTIEPFFRELMFEGVD